MEKKPLDLWLWVCIFLLPATALGQAVDSFLCDKGTKILKNYQQSSKPTDHIYALDRALLLFEKGKCWEDYILALNAKSRTFFYLRDYAQCELSTEKALEMATTYLGDSTSGYATALANYAVFVESFGKYNHSIELQLKSIEIEKKLFGIDHFTAFAWETLALTYQAMGDFDMALQYLKQALKVINASYLKNSHEAGRIMREIGNCFLQKKQFGKALKYNQEAMVLLEKLPKESFYEQTRWFAYLDATEIYKANKNLPQAYQKIEKALILQKKYDFIDAYKSYLLLGELYLADHKFEEALLAFQQSENAAKEEFKIYKYHQALAIPVSKQAQVYDKMRDFVRSNELYTQAIKLNSIPPDKTNRKRSASRPIYVHKSSSVDILNDQAKTFFQAYVADKTKHIYLEQAFKIYKEITRITHELRREYIAEGSKHVLIERTLPIYLEAVSVAQELYQLKGDEKYIEEAFNFAESNKAVLLYESIRNEWAKNLCKRSDVLLKQEKEIKLKASFLERRILEEKQKNNNLSQEKIEEYETKLFELEIKAQKIKKQIEQDCPSYAAHRKKGELKSLNEIRKNIPKKTAIIEFMLGSEKAFVFCLTKQKIISFELKKTKDWLSEIRKFRAILSTPPLDNENFKKAYEEYTYLANFLFKEFLEETLSLLPKNTTQLIIIPDDMLSYIPFENLITDRPTKLDYNYSKLPYLFKKYKISYHYSSSLMATSNLKNETVPSQKKFIGFAPSFDGTENFSRRNCNENELSNLHCNKEEVTRIHQLFKGEKLLAKEASATRFLEIAKNYNILHLATHACIQEESPDLNKIFFTDSNLTQNELNNLELNNELTVLSACNTGIGKLMKGEGLMSLTRSFTLAGSKSVLTSLWSVDDCSTSDIMVAYYAALSKGMLKNEALAQAKLEYLEHADQNNSHPYYWAAFVQFGSIDALQLSQVNLLSRILKGIFLILLILIIARKIVKPKKHV